MGRDSDAGAKPLVTLAKDCGAGGSVTAGEAGLNGIYLHFPEEFTVLFYEKS